MSLESKISELTTAIEKLTAQMAGTPINAEINKGPFYWREDMCKAVGTCSTRAELLVAANKWNGYYKLALGECSLETYLELSNCDDDVISIRMEAKNKADFDKILEEILEVKAIEEAIVDDKAMAKKINAEAKKKALAKAIRDAKKAEVEEKVEAVEEKVEAVEVTADDLKAACLTAARAEEGNKVKVKALLAKYDATVVKDVAPANRAEILAILESGEF